MNADNPLLPSLQHISWHVDTRVANCLDHYSIYAFPDRKATTEDLLQLTQEHLLQDPRWVNFGVVSLRNLLLILQDHELTLPFEGKKPPVELDPERLKRIQHVFRNFRVGQRILMRIPPGSKKYPYCYHSIQQEGLRRVQGIIRFRRYGEPGVGYWGDVFGHRKEWKGDRSTLYVEIDGQRGSLEDVSVRRCSLMPSDELVRLAAKERKLS